MVDDGRLRPVDRFEWERAVRLLKVGKETRYVGLVLAQFTDPDGTNAFPGQEVIAACCETSVRTVQRHLAALESAGLIECTFRGSTAGRRGLADVWRLTLPPDPGRTVGFIEDHPLLQGPVHSRMHTWG